MAHLYRRDKVGNQRFLAHIAHNFLGGVECTFGLVVFQKALENLAQHLGVNTNLGIIGVVLVDGEVVGG